jgi:site-specific DNA recombinase
VAAVLAAQTVNRYRLTEKLLGNPSNDDQLFGECTPLEIVIASQLLRCGKQMRLVVNETDDQPSLNPRLIGEVLRARRWFDALASGTAATIAAIAKTEGIAASYVSRKISLAFLAPDIVQSILDGIQPASLTPERLKKACPLPVSWEMQRALLLA